MSTAHREGNKTNADPLMSNAARSHSSMYRYLCASQDCICTNHIQLGAANCFLRPVHPDHMANVLSAYGTSIDLLRALDASANVTTVVEKRINLLRVANLAHVALLVSHFPMCHTFAPPFSILEAARILVPSPLLHKCALTVPLVLKPGSLVDVAVLVGHLALRSRTFPRNVWPFVRLAVRCNVCRRASVVQALDHRSGVVMGTEDIDRYVTRKGLSGMVPCGHPKISRKLFWVREFAF